MSGAARCTSHVAGRATVILLVQEIQPMAGPRFSVQTQIPVAENIIRDSAHSTESARQWSPDNSV